MRTAFRHPLLAASAVALLLGAATGTPAVELDVEALCNVGRLCRVKITFGGAEEDIVVTAFRANRVGPDMKYFPAEHYGRRDFGSAGLFHMERRIVLDDTGTFVTPRPEDAPDSVLHWTMTVALDPDGHATFFTGMLHAPGNSLARRAYVWGYPPTTVKNRGSIGGPRSPAAPRKLPKPEPQEQAASLRFTLRCDPANRCLVRVLTVAGGEVATATTEFPANLLGEDMRYYPSETAGGADLLAGGGVLCVELDVVEGPRGGLRSAGDDDPPDRVEKMTAAIALSSTGHVTFFYGFLADAGSDHVRRFLLWGYPPETMMTDDADGGDEGPLVIEADPRKT